MKNILHAMLESEPAFKELVRQHGERGIPVEMAGDDFEFTLDDCAKIGIHAMCAVAYGCDFHLLANAKTDTFDYEKREGERRSRDRRFDR